MTANETNPAATGMGDAAIDAKAKEMFDDYKDALAAPWERQWTGTRSYWRQKAIASLAAQPAPVVGGAIEALRSIAEGNLGDGPGQASYALIREFAAAALSTRPAESVAQGGEGFRGLDLTGRPIYGGQAALVTTTDSTTPATGSGGEVSELRLVAKRNLRSMIECGSDDKKLMLTCLEELS